MIDYEAEYNNRALVPEHPAIIEGWARDAVRYRSDANCTLAVAYELGERTVYDLFLPEAGMPERGPLGLFIHGGYWQGLDRTFFSHMAKGLNAHGIPVAVPSYSLCPQVRVGDIVEEIRRLVAHLWERYRRPVVAYGHSAGGQLTAALLATDWGSRGLPRGLVPAGLAISGVFDLQPLIGTSLNEKLRLDRKEAIDVSPIAFAAQPGTRLVAAVGGGESSEFIRQSRVIVDVWQRGGVRTELDIRGQDNHFTVIAPLADPDSDMTLRLVEMARSIC
ncbi:alpha/beta hydrolase [Stappia indica]|uniref:Alpha/beta hydrolase fold n=1 Tax=Stappia indica TaxID=538381 RepID=A0A285RSJ4_9HYPH|nr:alpha/beta hydrolase [Stappia indica]SOB96884.1 alpha/beta hydrolase fold [Stappia indica]